MTTTDLAMPAQPSSHPRNSLGVWSLVLGIASVVLALGVVTGIPAIIIGNQGRRAVRAGEADNERMAVTGVVLGWISLAILAAVIVLVIARFLAGGPDS
jgi:amino acid transporter